MTYWRKFIRWLARKEIALEAAIHEYDKAVAVSTSKTLSYIQGHHDGAREAMKILEEEVERTGKFGIDEMQAIKKRNVH